MKPTIEKIWIEWIDEEDPDLSFLGEYGNTYKDHAFSREELIGHSIPSGEYKYWCPTNHIPHNPRNWKHVSKKDRDETIKKHGSLKKADLAYATEDFWRMEKYGIDWGMTGCTAYAEVGVQKEGFVRLQRFSSGGLWGIESDSGKDFRREVEEEQLADLKSHLEDFGVDTTNFDDLVTECEGRRNSRE